MTTPSLWLEAVTYALADGRQLFTGLNACFDRVHTALVGRNGVGKSVLARILAGQLAPTAGCCRRHGTVHYLPQQIVCTPEQSVASLAGVAGVFDALARIQAGSCDELDFETVGERWDIATQLAIELQRQGLSAVSAQTPLACLSGGEQMRVALAGAWLARPDFLILDEPSNHLDRVQRIGLLERLEQWTGGLLVISHDRELLETLQRTLELTPTGLYDYGGGYSFYAKTREQQRQAAAARLQHSRLQRERGEQAICEQRERQQRRQARGNRAAQQANQAKILLGRQKEHSQASAGRLRRQHELTQQHLDAEVRAAVDNAMLEQPVALLARPAPGLQQRWPLRMQNLLLPFAAAGGHALNLDVAAGERIALTGANGTGKSTLLRVLANHLPAASGNCLTHGPIALLDQRLELLDPTRALLEQLQAVNPRSSAAQLRNCLALLGLGSDRVTVPCGRLSGGERVKAALACVLYAESPAQVLLLDEPSNHLDFPALQALEDMLGSYPGTLLVSSHDEVFLQRLRLHMRLNIDDTGWSIRPW